MVPKRRLSLAVVLVIAFAVIMAGAVYFDYNTSLKIIADNSRQAQVSNDFRPMKDRFEDFFALAYQSVRTIGLLPSVRAIQGSNRIDAKVDIVRSGRFSREGDATVQQLYNNLARNTNVSEIYCVLDGFTPEQAPFFMYDSIILGGRNASDSEDHSADTDVPEELESEEYGYYPKQLDHFRDTYPSFNFNELDDIPAVSGPALRTCDNTQYLSRSTGDPVNAQGFVYSVPFYSEAGDFKGIISAIFRTNTLEALMLDVPFVIVTEADKQEAKKQGFAMPGEPSRFVLANAETGLMIHDRRNKDIAARAVAAMASGIYDSKVFHIESLAINDSGKWSLYYEYDGGAILAASGNDKQRYFLTLSAIAIVALVVILWAIFDYKKRMQILLVAARLRDIAEGEANLTSRLDESRKDELGELSKWFNTFVAKLADIVLSLKDIADHLADNTQQLSSSAEQMSQGMSEQSDKATLIATSSSEMSQTIIDIAGNASNIAGSAAEAMKTSNDGAEIVTKSVSEVQNISHSVSESSRIIDTLKERSGQIGEILVVIEEIAEQTNLLALNAAIEAARAGEQGRGFAVVADEVRRLAERTAKSTSEITNMVVAIQEDTESASGAMRQSLKLVDSGVKYSEEAGRSFAQIVRKISELQSMVHQIATATEQMSSTSENVSGEVETIATISRQSSTSASAVAKDTNEIEELAGMLRDLVNRFKV